MNISDYRSIYDSILKLTYDTDGMQSTNPTKEDIEKCKWILAILECLDDVPKRKADYILKDKKIKFDYSDFIDSICDWKFSRNLIKQKFINKIRRLQKW